MTPRIDDISHARLCARCHRWGPEEATFCGHCGLQLRPIAQPATVMDLPRRRRRRRLLAMDDGGLAGLLGMLIGERIHDDRTAARREEQ